MGYLLVDGHFFVPSGVKINASCRELILEPVVKNLQPTVFNGKSFVFQQNGAPAHTENSTQDWLRSNIPGFIGKDQWFPYIPDLKPMDYSISSIFETKACSKSHKSIDSLKKSLVVEWGKVPQEVLRTAVEALPGRITAVIKNKGGYIE